MIKLLIHVFHQCFHLPFAALSQFLTLKNLDKLPGSKSKSRSVSHESGALWVMCSFQHFRGICCPINTWSFVEMIGWSRYTIEGKGQRSRFPETVFFCLLLGICFFLLGQRFPSHEKNRKNIHAVCGLGHFR